MQLKFLGVSAAFAVGKDKFNSNMLITSDSGKNLLIDCGSDARHSLHRQNLTHSDIDAVYISHLHADHVGGLEWLGYTKYFIDKDIPDLYLSHELSTKLWKNVLSGGMSTIENQEARLETYFKVHALQKPSFVWEGYNFELIKVLHSINNGHLVPCFGLLITVCKYKIFITTDTRFQQDYLMPAYLAADIIFQDCETSQVASCQHARYDELRTLPAPIKSKMWLYDYLTSAELDVKGDGFLGFVEVGRSFTFS